jgi:hypothetical protein
MVKLGHRELLKHFHRKTAPWGSRKSRRRHRAPGRRYIFSRHPAQSRICTSQRFLFPGQHQSSSAPPYSAPMPRLVKRLPFTSMRAFATKPAGRRWPSTRDLIAHKPCSRSRSSLMPSSRLRPKTSAPTNSKNIHRSRRQQRNDRQRNQRLQHHPRFRPARKHSRVRRRKSGAGIKRQK